MGDDGTNDEASSSTAGWSACGLVLRVRRIVRASVAATETWTDPDGFRSPAGEVHAWLPGTNQTLCGLPLKRSGLWRLPHIDWIDVQPATGRDADRVAAVCRRCNAATGRRRDEKAWTRTDPRP
jgi:hypothetical protein